MSLNLRYLRIFHNIFADLKGLKISVSSSYNGFQLLIYLIPVCVLQENMLAHAIAGLVQAKYSEGFDDFIRYVGDNLFKSL